jgi:hypothetical protein
LAKLQILNHLPTNPAEAADDIVSFDLVDFLLRASSSQGPTELTADHTLPVGADRVRRGADTAEDEAGASSKLRRSNNMYPTVPAATMAVKQGDTSEPSAELEVAQRRRRGLGWAGHQSDPADWRTV